MLNFCFLLDINMKSMYDVKGPNLKDEIDESE